MDISWGAVIGAAIGDSINPCAIAVLIYLVTFLTSIKGSRKKVATLGGIFVAMIFLTYFLIGLGLMTFVYKIPTFKLIYKVIGILVILAGLINIKDFIWHKNAKGPSLEIPKRYKPTIEKLIKRATLPTTFILGVLVSLFELPCTGGIYLVIIAHLARGTDRAQALLSLLVYNFFFVLPMIVLLALGAFGVSGKTMEKWRKTNRRWLKLMMGTVMILLGVMMISDFL